MQPSPTNIIKKQRWTILKMSTVGGMAAADVWRSIWDKLADDSYGLDVISVPATGPNEASEESPAKRQRISWPTGVLRYDSAPVELSIDQTAGEAPPAQPLLEPMLFSVLLWKPHQKALNYRAIVPAQGQIVEESRVNSQGLGNQESSRRVVGVAQLRRILGDTRVSNLQYLEGAEAAPKEVVDAVREMPLEVFETQVIQAKVKGKDSRTDYQTTLVVGYAHLASIRAAHAEALRVKALGGVILANATCVPAYPADFNEQALANLLGVVWSAERREDIRISFHDYVNSSLHLTASCVMCGAPGLGKTPLLYAVCAEFACRYLKGVAEPYFLTANTIEGFRDALQAGLLVQGAPLLVEDFRPNSQTGGTDRLSTEEYLVNQFGVLTAYIYIYINIYIYICVDKGIGIYMNKGMYIY